MIDMLRSIVDFMAYVANLAPGVAWPALLAVVFSMAVTEHVKRRYVRRRTDWTKEQRDTFLHRFGFWVGLSSTWSLWALAETSLKQRIYGGFWAVIVGIATPYLWAAFVRVLGWWRPDVREYLSSDTVEMPRPEESPK